MSDTEQSYHVFASCTECDFEVGREQDTAFRVETSDTFREASKEALNHSKDMGHAIIYGEP